MAYTMGSAATYVEAHVRESAMNVFDVILFALLIFLLVQMNLFILFFLRSRKLFPQL